MERFYVEGTSLVSWTIRVQAQNQREAVEEAGRIAGGIDLRSSVATVNAAQHRIVGWGAADPDDQHRGGFIRQVAGSLGGSTEEP